MGRSATLSAEASAEEFVADDRDAENWVEVGKALRARREERGLTQEQEAALQSVLDKLDEILADRLNEIMVPHLNQTERQLRALPDVIYHPGRDIIPVIDLDQKDQGS